MLAVAGFGSARAPAACGQVQGVCLGFMASPRRIVLILDHDEATRELYRRELSRRFQVIPCKSEGEAWASLEQQVVDAVVLELTALDDEEWSFVARLRTMGGSRNLPIVICSTLDARRRGSELGAAAYLIKPVTPQALLSVLSAALHDAGAAARV